MEMYQEHTKNLIHISAEAYKKLT